MNGQATKLEAAENHLKELMADVTRAMEKAPEAVARIASKAAAAQNPPRARPNLAYPVNADIHYIWGASSRRNKVLRRSALQPRPRYQVTI